VQVINSLSPARVYYTTTQLIHFFVLLEEAFIQ
jgi:hypothetical protein